MFGIKIPDVPEVDAEKVYADIKDKKDILLLDVRTPQEYSREHIEKSIHIPLQELIQNLENEIPDKNASIYVYCLSGSRSASAVAQMLKMGYKNVYSMTSGLLAWRIKNYPLVRN